MNTHTILFLAASPLYSDRLALDQEARAIHTELARSGYRHKFTLVTRWAVQPLDLLRELRSLKPTVVHFCGLGTCVESSLLKSSAEMHYSQTDHATILNSYRHADLLINQNQHGLFFQGNDGRPQFVSAAALKETFGAAGTSVKVAVLSSCYSEMQAKALLAHIDCVIGMSGSICDDVAVRFAIGFYGGIGERESIAAAYRQGCAAISLEGLPNSERPQLKVRHDLDAEKLILADAPLESSVKTCTSLKFSLIAIDAQDKNWHASDHLPDRLRKRLEESPPDEETAHCDFILKHWPFKHPAHLHFAKKVATDGDPLFDITIMNMVDIPVIVTAIGIEILSIARRPTRWLCRALPKAAKILKHDSYTIDIPDIIRLYSIEDGHSTDIRETVYASLPDPIYLESRAPYRHGLSLKDYYNHMPSLARIRICILTDCETCYSREIEMSK